MLGTATTAAVPLPFQPEMVPFRSAKMKRAAAATVPLSTWKDDVGLATWPVGPWGPLAVVEIVTVRACLATFRVSVTAYRVAVLVPWFEIQNGLVGRRELPQGFTKLGAVRAARPGISETRSVWRKSA